MVSRSEADDVEVEFCVELLNKRWHFRGFQAIRELVEFMDAHASFTERGDHTPPPLSGEVG